MDLNTILDFKMVIFQVCKKTMTGQFHACTCFITMLLNIGQCVHRKDTITVKNISNNNHYPQTNFETKLQTEIFRNKYICM